MENLRQENRRTRHRVPIAVHMGPRLVMAQWWSHLSGTEGNRSRVPGFLARCFSRLGTFPLAYPDGGDAVFVFLSHGMHLACTIWPMSPVRNK